MRPPCRMCLRSNLQMVWITNMVRCQDCGHEESFLSWSNRRAVMQQQAPAVPAPAPATSAPMCLACGKNPQQTLAINGANRNICYNCLVAMAPGTGLCCGYRGAVGHPCLACRAIVGGPGAAPPLPTPVTTPAPWPPPNLAVLCRCGHSAGDHTHGQPHYCCVCFCQKFVQVPPALTAPTAPAPIAPAPIAPAPTALAPPTLRGPNPALCYKSAAQIWIDEYIGLAPAAEPAAKGTCPDCSRELSDYLDAYYGKDPGAAARCSKCRGPYEKRSAPFFFEWPT